MLNGLLQDVRYALRVFTSARGFSVGVIGSLTLGIAVNAIAFAMINAMFLRALPGIESPRRVVRIELCRWTEHSSCRWESSSYDDYRVMRGSLRSLSDLSARVLGHVAARIRGEAVTLRAAFVSPNYFDVLGARLPLGRTFVAAEENGPVAIISHGLWRRHFLEDRSVLGEFVDVGTISVRIVGVAPEDFLGAAVAGDGRDVWIPFGMMSGAVSPMRTSPFGVSRPAGHHQIDYIGRLGPDATLESARAEANVFVGSLVIAASRSAARYGARVRRFAMRDWTTDRLLEAVAIIMPLPLVVLGIACLNAASLLLARATYRMRETTVRLALGATRWRVVRYVLIESALLALVAAVLAVVVTIWAIRVLEPLMPMSIPLDWHVLAFTAALAGAAAVLFGFVPALRSSSGKLALGSSRVGDTGLVAPRLRHALVLVQVAASLGLLATGTQSVSAVSTLLAATGADDPDRLLLASFDLDHLKMRPETGQDFYRRLLDTRDADAAGRGRRTRAGNRSVDVRPRDDRRGGVRLGT